MSSKTCLLVALVLALALLWGGTAEAHDYMYGDNWASLRDLAIDFDRILDEMFTTYAGCNLWSTSCDGASIWSQVAGQQGPDWATADNGAAPGTFAYTGTGVVDADQMALLDAVLNPNNCTAALPPARVTAIRAAFAANLAKVLTEELTINNVRISTGSIPLCNFDFTTSVTTGQPKTITLSGGGTFCLANGQSFTFDVPSLFGTFGDGPLLAEAHPELDLALANLTAAYMTLGDDRTVSYWYAFTGRLALTFVQELLPGLLESIGRDAVRTSITADEIAAWRKEAAQRAAMPLPDFLKEPVSASRWNCPPWGDVGGVDETITVTVDIIGEVDLRIRLTDQQVCTTITNFANKFTCANYNCTNKAYLATEAGLGDLNDDTIFNLVSYQNSSNYLQYIGRESAGYPSPMTITQQPASVQVVAGGNHTFTADWQKYSTEPYTRQWYSGTQSDGSDLAPIPGQTNAFLSLTNLTTLGTTYYQFRVADACSNTASSNIVSLEVVPPPINITQQPTGGTVLLQKDITLTVAANIAVGTLSYQWQKQNGAVWDNLPGETGTSLAITGAEFGDAGTYRCFITSVSYPTRTLASLSAAVVVNVPPISISQQPLGANVDEGSPVVLTVTAAIDLTPPEYLGTLSYEWYFNGAPTGVTTTTYSIPAAGPGDVGDYFVRIESDDFPLGDPKETIRDSAVAAVSLKSGVAFRVDQTAPQPGGLADGQTWETAYHTIQEGINAAAGAGGGEVWVAGGPGPGGYVYDEVRTEPWGGPTAYTGSLIMKDLVEVYGGFEGYAGQQEDFRSQRAVRRVDTIIDGSVSRAGNAAYHVVVFGRLATGTQNARLDGFTVRGGRASGTAGNYHTWRGAGIYNWLSSPVIANCTFTDNVAAVSGGAIANESGASPANAVIQNCVFYANTADRLADDTVPAPNPVRGGAAIFNNFADATILYCTIYGNAAGNLAGFTEYGLQSGGIYSWDCTPAVVSSIIWANTGGGLNTENETLSVSTTVSYSDVQADSTYSDGGNNISTAPLFLATGPEFQLDPLSPCVDTADPGLASPDRDIQGVPRPQPAAGVPDMGAYEVVDAPTLTCKDATLVLSALNTVTLFPSAVTDAPLTQVPATVWKARVDGQESITYDCAAVGTPQTVTLSIIDRAGNVAQCTATVDVLDEEDPVAVCQNITVGLDQVLGTYTLTAAEVDGGSTDNCGTVNLSIPPTTYTCADIDETRVVTLTVTDGSGNTDTCTAQVTIVDDTGPVMSCVGSLTVQLDENGQASIDVADVDTGTADACGTVERLELSQTDFTCADLVGVVGVVTVTLEAEDNRGNIDTCDIDVTVEDSIVPVITLNGPAEITLLQFIDTYTEQGAVASDNCDPDTAATVGGDTVDTNVLGTYIVEYDYTDASGNAAVTVTRTVNVIDDPPAVITILGDNPYLVECPAAYQDPGATAVDEDLGDITDQIDVTGLPIPVTVPGTYIVEYSVFDDVGTETVEQRTVIVADTVKPVITLIGDSVIGLELGDTYTEPGATVFDACDGAVAVVITGTVDTNTVGTYLVDYDATDADSNVADTVTRTVIVVAELLNFVTQPEGAAVYVDDVAFDLTATFSGGQNPATYEWTEATLGVVDSGAVAGNAISLTVDPATYGVGTHVFQGSVTDDIGTVSTDTASVLVATHMSITDDIEDAEVIYGENHSMTFGVEGGLGALSYQWQLDADSVAKVDWQDLADTGNVSGTGTDTLTITGFLPENEGAYRCLVDDEGTDPTLSSSVAVLTGRAGVPAAGLLGLLSLAAMSALGGAAAIRRRK